jgi:hypothetical protein
MDEVLKWLLKNGQVVIRAGELVMAIGEAVRDSIAPKKPRTRKKG